MSNTFITVKQIAREALPRLIDNLVFPNLIYRDTACASAARMGDTVSVRRPVKLTARDFSADAGVITEDITEDAVSIKLDRIATVDTEISALDGALDMESMARLFIEPAAAALAEKINADGLGLYRDIPYVGGTAGKTPDALGDFAEAAFMLDINKVPTGSRCAVWDPSATAAFKQIPALINAEKCGSSAALRSGSIGEVFGISSFMSQAVKAHEAGTLKGTGLRVAQSVNDSGTVQLTGDGISGTVNVGDILKIGSKTYTVKREGEVASGVITVNIYPNTCAEKDEAVALFGSHTANLVFHPSAFAFVTRPLAAPAGVESYVTTYNGISLRVVRGYDMKHKREMLSMDVLYSFATLYPELACRYMG